MGRAALVALLILCLPAAFAAGGPQRSVPVDRVQSKDCPVEVLEKNTRAGPGVDPSPWRDHRGEGAPPAGTFPPEQPAEPPVVFHLVFRNRSDRTVNDAAFVWEALGERGETLYRRVSVYPGRPLAPGRIESVHEIDLEPKGGPTARYRVTPLKVVFGDGSVWEAKKSEQP